VAAGVVGADPVAQPWVVGVGVPLVVVAPVQPGVVRGIATDQVALSAVAVQADHRLQVVALDDEILRLRLGVADRVLGERSADAGTDAPRETPSKILPGELNPDPSLLSSHELQKLVVGQLGQGPAIRRGEEITERHWRMLRPASHNAGRR
jgi:hypothetical protein